MENLKTIARQMRIAGKSYNQIAKEIGKHRSLIWNWTKDLPKMTKDQIRLRKQNDRPRLNISFTKEICYLIGLGQTDGHLHKDPKYNKGSFTIQLKASDQDILYALQKHIPCHSSIKFYTRDTNFKKNYHHVTLYVSDLRFRTFLNENGIPYGKKSQIVEPQIRLPFQVDYIRGLVDGDGSLGLTATNTPFLSLAIASKSIANFFATYISRFTSNPKSPHFRKDNTYDITILSEAAQMVATQLYYPDCLCLNRKRRKAELVKNWIRPADRPIRISKRKSWDTEQDKFILSHTLKESCSHLERSPASIKTRLYNLY